MIVTVKHKEEIIFKNIKVAQNVFSRILGLMFKKTLGPAEGLLLCPCNSIHTFFMHFPIDVVFMSKEGTIIKILRNLPPWRVTRIYFSAKRVLEVGAGKIPLSIEEGQKLELCYV